MMAHPVGLQRGLVHPLIAKTRVITWEDLRLQQSPKDIANILGGNAWHLRVVANDRLGLVIC